MQNELNQKKNQISDLYFSSYHYFCTQIKSPQFSMSFHNSENKNHKFDFSFDSASSALHISHENGIKTEGRGVCISLVGTGPRFCYIDRKYIYRLSCAMKNLQDSFCTIDL